MEGPPQTPRIPPALHVINFGGVLLGGGLLLLTTVVRPYQLLVLVPVLLLLIIYWRLRANPRIAASYFGGSLALFAWILFCENVVAVDNTLGTQISRSLRLDWRLQSYVDENLHTPDRLYFEPCCNDPLTWHYRPGSLYRATFDCATCNPPDEVRVDETGYLNRPPHHRYHDQDIELFVAGDSVLQGMGVPSVVEWLREQLPVRMWNLSIRAYGPRQKISALLAYALPKQPQWIVVEFYAGNDLGDEIRNDVCAAVEDFRCRYNEPEVRWRLAAHPVYQTIFDVSDEGMAGWANLATHNLTLATTRFLVDHVKMTLKATLMALTPGGDSASAAEERLPADVGAMPWFEFKVRPGQWVEYLQVGLRLTQDAFLRLVAELEKMSPQPRVILLYNPTPYEIYRGLWVPADPDSDQASTFLRANLREFAEVHGWRFLDLTNSLRQEVHTRHIRIFGQYDRTHWSLQGTAVVAKVLATELWKIIGSDGRVVIPSTSSPGSKGVPWPRRSAEAPRAE